MCAFADVKYLILYYIEYKKYFNAISIAVFVADTKIRVLKNIYKLTSVSKFIAETEAVILYITCLQYC